jgi:hypothetical protein
MFWSISLFSAGIGLFSIIQKRADIPKSFSWLEVVVTMLAAFAAVGMIGASVFTLVGRWRIGLLVAWILFGAAIIVDFLFL